MSNEVKFAIVIPRVVIEHAVRGSNLTYERAVAVIREGKQVTDPRSK